MSRKPGAVQVSVIAYDAMVFGGCRFRANLIVVRANSSNAIQRANYVASTPIGSVATLRLNRVKFDGTAFMVLKTASVSDVCSAEIETDVVATSAIPSVLESFDHGDLLSTDTEEVLAVPNVPDEAGPPRRATP